MLSFLLTVYTIAGLSVMAFIVVNIAFENKFTKFQIKCMKIFPIHTLVIFLVCVISYSAYYYIEKLAKKQEGLMSINNVYKIMSKIQSELRAWNVSVELNADVFEGSDNKLQESFMVTIFTDLVEDPIRLTIPVNELEDYNIENTIQILKFELESYLDNGNVFFYATSQMIH